MLNAQTLYTIRQKKPQKPGKNKTIPPKKPRSSAKRLVSSLPTAFLPKGEVKEPPSSTKVPKPARLHAACSCAEHKTLHLPPKCSGHSEVSPSPSQDTFCHGFSPTLSLCTHIPTPYLILSFLYSSLVLCNAHPVDQLSTLAVPIPDRAQK